MSDIQYLTQQQIDREKWDRCVRRADNGLVYSFSFYLDHMARHWDALVLGDYEAVMPLTWHKKYGIAYLYQPFLAAQLGITGNHLDAKVVETFLHSIPSHFKYIDIYLNHQNVFPIPGFPLYQRVNFVLNLGSSYDVLIKGYRENIRRNTKKAEQAGCTLHKDIPVTQVIDLALLQMREHSDESNENAKRFEKLYTLLQSRQMAMTYGMNDAKGELVASCVFFFSHNRIYYILVGNHPNGKTLGASHALIDAVIKEYAGQNFLLDFEGSDVPSLAFFYSSFGGVEEKYAGLRMNRLPFYLRWMKK